MPAGLISTAPFLVLRNCPPRRKTERSEGARRGPADDLSGSGGRRGRRVCELPAPPTLEMMQVCMAGPDDEWAEAPTFLTGGSVTHNGRGPLRVTRPQKRGRKMHGSIHVSGSYSWKKIRGGRKGGC
jgi:hypothetical protein